MFCIWVELLVQRRHCPIFVRDVGSPDIHECFRRLTGSQRTPRIWGVTVVLDFEFGAEIPELRIVELFPIVRHEGPRDLEPAYYRTPDKVTYLLFCDCCKGFGLGPLGKVVHCHNDKLALAPSNG